jgi:hypothetical protein
MQLEVPMVLEVALQARPHRQGATAKEVTVLVPLVHQEVTVLVPAV